MNIVEGFYVINVRHCCGYSVRVGDLVNLRLHGHQVDVNAIRGHLLQVFKALNDRK